MGYLMVLNEFIFIILIYYIFNILFIIKCYNVFNILKEIVIDIQMMHNN